MPKIKNLNHVIDEKLPHLRETVKRVESIGSSKFLLGLVLFVALWAGANIWFDHNYHTSIAPTSFMLVLGIIQVAYTFLIVVTERARNEREKVANDHQTEINQQIADYLAQLLKEQRVAYRDIRNTVIMTCDPPETPKKEETT